MQPSPNFFKRLTDSDSLTDVLIQMEDFLDSLDLYVFKNWFDGEIVQGPDIRRYWVSMTLKYPYEKMPDPSGAERLIQHGAYVDYRKAEEESPVEVNAPDDLLPSKKPKMKKDVIWLVEIQIPRRFVEELDDSDLEMYVDDDNMVDVEDVSDARDENIDDEDAFTDDGNAEETEEPTEEDGDL